MTVTERALNHCTRHGVYEHDCAWCRVAEQSMASATNTRTSEVMAANLKRAVKALEHIAESAEHPSLTVRTTEYLGHVAREALAALALPRKDETDAA